jgi:hypothetical protein
MIILNFYKKVLVPLYFNRLFDLYFILYYSIYPGFGVGQPTIEENSLTVWRFFRHIMALRTTNDGT